MIPEQKTQRSVATGVLREGACDISLRPQDRAHMMALLREGIYTDRILAVLREYYANAWDIHQVSGKGDTPVQVHIPTYSDPVLRIRDYGVGLCPDKVFEYFGIYGLSPSRGTNKACGAWGIGAKAGAGRGW